MALSFVNKLDGNQVLILSKVINEFITEIQDKYQSINDYILKTSFDELQTSYNVKQQQEKNNEIIQQNQVEQGQVLKENLPAEEESQGKTEEIKMSDFLSKIFKLEGVQGFGKPELKKTIIGELLYDNAEAFRLITLPSQALNERLEEEVLMVLEEANDLDKEALRLDLQRRMIFIFKNNRTIPRGIREKAKNLKLLASMEGLMLGSGYISEPHNEYIPIGKYKAHKTKLMGGKLQIRSSNNHQVMNLKSQVITKKSVIFY